MDRLRVSYISLLAEEPPSSPQGTNRHELVRPSRNVALRTGDCLGCQTLQRTLALQQHGKPAFGVPINPSDTPKGPSTLFLQP